MTFLIKGLIIGGATLVTGGAVAGGVVPTVIKAQQEKAAAEAEAAANNEIKIEETNVEQVPDEVPTNPEVVPQVKDPEPEILVEKGDVIELEGKKYLVLDVDGSEAKLLGKENVNVMYFNEGSMNNAYKDSGLDEFLNETYFNSLSQVIKDAIIPSSIKVGQYGYNAAVAGKDPNPGDKEYVLKGQFIAATNNPNFNTWPKAPVFFDEEVSENLDRKIFAPGIQDLADYMGKDGLDTDKIAEMFDVELGTQDDEDIILLSSWVDPDVIGPLCFMVNGQSLSLDLIPVCNLGSPKVGARPCFFIDLDKCGDFEIIE